jgi:hypothetical protein
MQFRLMIDKVKAMFPAKTIPEIEKDINIAYKQFTGESRLYRGQVDITNFTLLTDEDGFILTGAEGEQLLFPLAFTDETLLPAAVKEIWELKLFDVQGRQLEIADLTWEVRDNKLKFNQDIRLQTAVKIRLYAAMLPADLSNEYDFPPFSEEFHEGPVLKVTEDYLLQSRDLQTASYYGRKYNDLLLKAKRHAYTEYSTVNYKSKNYY